MLTLNPITGTDAALGDSQPFSQYPDGILEISGLATEKIKVTGIIGVTDANSGQPEVASSAIRVSDSAGVLAAAAALDNGLYYFDNYFRKLRFTKSAGVDAATVRIQMREKQE